MPDPSDSIPGPSDAEVRLATEKVHSGARERVAPQEGIRLMEERIAGLKQKIADWKRILEQSPSDETARECHAVDVSDLSDAEIRLREYRLQSMSQN